MEGFGEELVFPQEQGPGSPEPGRDAGLGFPQPVAHPWGGGYLCRGPLFRLRLAQRRAGLRTCPYGSCTIVTASCPDLTHAHLAEGEAPCVPVIPCRGKLWIRGCDCLNPPGSQGRICRGTPFTGWGNGFGDGAQIGAIGPALGGRCGARHRLAWKGVCVMSVASAPLPQESSGHQGWRAK